jgi:Scramblase
LAHPICSSRNSKNQFSTIDSPFLGWDFDLRDEQGELIGNVNRNFVGFAREVSKPFYF